MSNRLRSVNWIDGMKINKSHFSHVDQFNQQQRCDLIASQLRSYNFGLIRQDQALDASSIYVEDDWLLVKSCKMILSSGLILTLEETDQVKLDLRAVIQDLEEDSSYLVAISCDANQMLPTGEPNANELPPRQPYLRPKVHLIAMASEETKSIGWSQEMMPLCRVIFQNDRFQLDDQYLPPSAQSNAHHAVLTRYENIEKNLGQIGMDATQVVQKARSKKRRGEINDLAENTFYVIEKVVFFLAEQIHQVRTVNKENSPILLFLLLNNFGRVVLTALKCLKNVDREALLRYYESHVGLLPHQFESEMRELSQLEYDHSNLNRAFDKADKYLNTLKVFMRKAVDLEYHSVERVDVVQEKTVKKSKLDIF